MFLMETTSPIQCSFKIEGRIDFFLPRYIVQVFCSCQFIQYIQFVGVRSLVVHTSRIIKGEISTFYFKV